MDVEHSKLFNSFTRKSTIHSFSQITLSYSNLNKIVMRAFVNGILISFFISLLYFSFHFFYQCQLDDFS